MIKNNPKKNSGHHDKIKSFRKTISLFITFLFFIIVLSGCSNYKKKYRQFIHNEKPEKALKYTIKQSGIPGMTAAVFSSSEIYFLEAGGKRKKLGIIEIRPDNQIEIDDLFHLGSNTKQIISFLAGFLVEEGQLSWDTKITDVFPDWKNDIHSSYLDKTLKDLLSHQAGIRKFTGGAEFEDLPEFTGDAPEQRKQFSKHVLTLEPAAPTNQASYLFSHAGYVIAATMIEKTTGESWKKTAEKRIFDPLGIEDYYGWPNRIKENSPWGHYTTMQRIPQSPRDSFVILPILEPSLDLTMNTHDYVLFLQENLKGLQGKDGLLRSGTVRKIHQYHQDDTDYALGWVKTVKNGHRLSMHDGTAGTFYCTAVLFEDEDFGIAVMANSGSNIDPYWIYLYIESLIGMFLDQYVDMIRSI